MGLATGGEWRPAHWSSIRRSEIEPDRGKHRAARDRTRAHQAIGRDRTLLGLGIAFAIEQVGRIQPQFDPLDRTEGEEGVDLVEAEEARGESREEDLGRLVAHRYLDGVDAGG